MSTEALVAVLERASTDAAFRAQLTDAPESALAGYSLSGSERQALLSGDSGQLRALGVDARVAKMVECPTIPGADEPPII